MELLKNEVVYNDHKIENLRAEMFK